VRGRQVFAESLRGCIEFILRQQSSDGSWTDWALPPGPSYHWVTAYIGCQLAAVPPQLCSLGAPERRAAAQWLARREFNEGGWGYNDKVVSDADSTAHAIVFLSRAGMAVSERSYKRLTDFQQSDGGFSTYPSDEGLGSWGLSHPDVTAVAARALLTKSGSYSTALNRATEYLMGQREANGMWNSFWWDSPLYATEASLSLFRATGVRIDFRQTERGLSGVLAENPFERALLICCFRHVMGEAARMRADALARRLIAEQLSDGSWANAPILRVTDRDCTRPWEFTRAGVLYADPRLLFTSATVLRALCAVMDRQAS
jgi:squalene cyclase